MGREWCEMAEYAVSQAVEREGMQGEECKIAM